MFQQVNFIWLFLKINQILKLFMEKIEKNIKMVIISLILDVDNLIKKYKEV